MAIALRGTPTTGSASNGGNITLSLPAGLAQDDVVLAFCGTATTTTNTTSSSGWTRIDGGAASTYIKVYRKVMGASPDASIVLLGDGSSISATAGMAIAFSGVDTTTPEDGVTPVLAGPTTSTDPDPPSITPNTTGAAIIAVAGTRTDDIVGTAGPTGYSNFTQINGIDSVSITGYLAWKNSLTGGVAENPSAFTGVSSAGWVACSVVLKPAATNKIIIAVAGSYAVTGTDASVKQTRKITALAGSYAVSGTDATTRKTWKLAALAGSYAVTGTDANIFRTGTGKFVAATTGTYAVTGSIATLLKTWRPVALAGSYAVTGSAVTLTLLHTKKLAADAGSYLVSGADVSLVSSDVNQGANTEGEMGVPLKMFAPSVITYVEITPTVLASDAYDANDVVFDMTLVPNFTWKPDQPMVLNSIAILDEDDEAAANWTFWFSKSSSTFGTADAAPSLTDAVARDLLGYYTMASANILDIGGSKFGYATGLNILCVPASGTRNMYVAATTAGTPTFTTTSDVKIRLGFIG